MDVQAAIEALAHGEPYELPGLGHLELVPATATTRRRARFVAEPTLLAALAHGASEGELPMAQRLRTHGEAALPGIGRLRVDDGEVRLKADRAFLRKLRLPADRRPARPTMDGLLRND